MATPGALVLREIDERMAAAYLDMIEDFEAAGGYPYNDAAWARRDFPAFARDQREYGRGIGLPPHITPQSTYVLLEDGERALGEIRFRPSIPPPYRTQNGHAGYNIRPSERGKGYGTRLLALLVDMARVEGLMLPVEGLNPASVRVIEKNGGKPAHRDADPATGVATTWYWIPR